jgi:D-proline reductase (dithiol) PrdB
VTKQVDSYCFLDYLTRTVVKAWIAKESAREIPWTPLSRSLADCTVALISSGGIALKSDRPFDQEGERQNPWWGDPSYRVLPRTATAQDVGVYHLHIDASFALHDLNCLLPLQRLLELEEDGTIGGSAAHHYSFMGYTCDPTPLLEESTPAIIRQLRDDHVDVVVLVPA